MGIAGEKAYEQIGETYGSGSYKVFIIDQIYKFSTEDIENLGKAYEE